MQIFPNQKIVLKYSYYPSMNVLSTYYVLGSGDKRSCGMVWWKSTELWLKYLILLWLNF